MQDEGMTRREAVGRVGMAGAAGVLMSNAAFAGVVGAEHMSGDNASERASIENRNERIWSMSSDDWRFLLGEDFQILGPSFAASTSLRSTTGKLVCVDDHNCDSDSQRTSELRTSELRPAGYSLVFELPLNANLESQTYSIGHEKLGKFDFHLQYICYGNDHIEFLNNTKSSQFYEAVIN